MRLTRSFRLILGTLIFVTGVLPLAGCSTNPATGKMQFNTLSEADEITIGTEAQGDFIRGNGGHIPSPRLTGYVSDLGHRLAAVSESPQLPWEFHTLNTNQINAFALPGGKIFISRGLMARMTNEAQLVGVLGHEVGHVTAQHVSTRMTRSRMLQGAVVLLGAAAVVSNQDWVRILGASGSAVSGVYLLKFGRDQESQSDELGVRYMTRLGYDPRGQVEVMQILKEAAGGGAGSEFFSTHPLPDTRIDRLNEHIDDYYTDAGTGGRDQAGRDAFKRNVLDELARLPDPPAGRE